MKIGMELDPIEDLERAIERAIATAARAQFGGGGNASEAFAEVHRLSRARLDIDTRELRSYA